MRLLQLPLDEYRRRLEDDEDCSEVVDFLDFVRPAPLRFFAKQSDFEDLYVHLVRRLEDGQRRLRLWSAGCGSGEEPYGMLMIALSAVEAAGVTLKAVDLKVLATDISARALDLGRRGLFDASRVSKVPGRMLDIFFTETDEGLLFDERERSRVFFRRLNLARPPYPMAGPFDAIFCAEGLAPMVARARKRVVDAARALLAEGGLMHTGIDYQAMAKAAKDEETLRQERTLQRIRSHGHC